MTSQGMPSLETVGDTARAELLMHPLRRRILAEAREASTAAQIARRVGLTPQKVNYHVRTLAGAGFLEPAGEGRKRNLVEKRYRASAKSYLLLPRILGDMSPGPPADADRFSATYLMQLAAQLQNELAGFVEGGKRAGSDTPTLSIEAELRFDSPRQRAAFADELRAAVTDVVGRFTRPARDDAGRPTPGRPFRLVIGCYPVPATEPEKDTHDEHERPS